MASEHLVGAGESQEESCDISNKRKYVSRKMCFTENTVSAGGEIMRHLLKGLLFLYEGGPSGGKKTIKVMRKRQTGPHPCHGAPL